MGVRRRAFLEEAMDHMLHEREGRPVALELATDDREELHAEHTPGQAQTDEEHAPATRARARSRADSRSICGCRSISAARSQIHRS